MKNAYEIRGEVTAIFIKSKGNIFETIIDTSDLQTVIEFNGNWYAFWNKRTDSYYAMGNSKMVNYIYKKIFLHRYLMNDPIGFLVDHKNHDTLDNRRSCNLRKANNFQNMQNRNGLDKNNTSGYRGVSYNKVYGRFEAYSRKDKKKICLGHFDDALQAAKVAYQYRKIHMPFSNEYVEVLEA